MNYAGIDESFSSYDQAQVLLQSIPYDGTSTWGKGADRGFDAFMHASENMELYDIETATEVYKKGIHVLPAITEKESPESMFNAVYDSTKLLLPSGKFLTFFGGEHSISIGIMKAFYEYHEDLTILQLDAHADLRPSYLGSPYNHACALHDASKHSNLIQVGIRSMDSSEMEHLNADKVFYAHEIMDDEGWMQRSIDMMSEKVYITFDLDALDPSIMPSTGTPEPGGMSWYQVTSYLRSVFKQRNVVGFDIVELAPIPDQSGPDFLAAKLYYKMLSYKFESHD